MNDSKTTYDKSRIVFIDIKEKGKPKETFPAKELYRGHYLDLIDNGSKFNFFKTNTEYALLEICKEPRFGEQIWMGVPMNRRNLNGFLFVDSSESGHVPRKKFYKKY